jgi:cytochrome P450
LEALTYRLLTDKNEAPKTARLSSEEMVDEVTPRLLILMFAAFDTTALTLSHAILDLMYQDQEIYAQSLRAEAIAAIADSKKKWALRDLNRLELMDR